MTDEWLAGFFDGEGCITHCQKKFIVVVKKFLMNCET